MTTDKKVSTATKVIYWITTGVLGLFILPGIFFLNSEMAKEGMKHMMMPQWFAYEVGIGSFIGGVILLIPMWKRLKEWAYVALGITYISAFIGHMSIDGFGRDAITAIVMFGVLLVSYLYYHKIND